MLRMLQYFFYQIKPEVYALINQPYCDLPHSNCLIVVRAPSSPTPDSRVLAYIKKHILISFYFIHFIVLHLYRLKIKMISLFYYLLVHFFLPN